MNEWKTQTDEELFKTLETTSTGLSQVEAVKRLKQYGENALKEKKPTSLFVIALRQFLSPFVLVLVVAAMILIFLQEYVDSVVIAVVLVVNAIIGVVQEGKAQNTLLALKKFTKTKTLVLRDGSEVRIDSTHVVIGDVLALRAGDKVPADARLIEAHNLRLNESALTGESESVDKSVHQAVDQDDTKGIVFKGTYVSTGSGRAVVAKTGEETVIGSISRRLETIDAEVPLKENIRQVSRLIIVGTLIASVLIIAFGFVAGYPFREMFFLAVAVAVSVIPEGLPVIITLILALGVHKMGKRNALVKRMQAVEALGQADVVAVDKTGTITRNELMVSSVYVDGTMYVVEGKGYEGTGTIYTEGKPVSMIEHPDLIQMVRIGVLSSDASVYKKEDSENWEVIGDPTEASLIVLGQKTGIDKDTLSGEIELLQDMSFQSELQYHAVLYKEKKSNRVYATGAPEKLLALSSHYKKDGKVVPMTDASRELFLQQVHEISEKGQRVLAAVTREKDETSIDKESVKDMTFIGFYGMADSIREGVKESVAVAKRSGVEIVMITGDYKGTALAIAEEAGIFQDGDMVLTGNDIKDISEEDLAGKLDNVTVFARVTPEQKFTIVNAYKSLGKKIAMTGDGVNDALSLVSADLGIGMGQSGTEVAKEASDIVLLDDDIKSILAAIEEGRNIYATIRKVLLYLFSTNLSELLIIVVALFLFLPLPLQPSQILWLNLVTATPIMALLFEKKRQESLGNTKKGTFIINKEMTVRLIIMAIVMTTGGMTAFYLFQQQDVAKGWTMALTVMAFFQWFNVWNVRSSTETIFKKDTIGNPYIILSILIVLALQLFAIYTPFMNSFLKITPLLGIELLLAAGIASSIIAVEEIRKIIYRKVYV